jgi:hypothetical protein
MYGILLHNDGRFAEAVEKFARAEALGNRPQPPTAATPCWIWAAWTRLCARTRRLSSAILSTPARSITWR